MVRLFQKTKDGGPDSPVDAYFLCEFKPLFSVALLKFNKGKRETYHTHAFNALTWFLGGDLIEERKILGGNLPCCIKYVRRFWPKFTSRDNLHRVKAVETSWCLTIRGPWTDSWQEFDENRNILTTLTHGRYITKMEFDPESQRSKL